jgi:uncharacterized protein YdeI (YjbR/CyaY-like superfamily)
VARVLGEHKGRPCVLVESRDDWHAWLVDHHATSGTIWLARWKRDSGRPHLSYDDLVEEALCFGWIDSTINAYDDDRNVILVAPRKKGGTWSRVNKERLERLEAAGLLQPPGIEVIEAAKADGSWTVLDGPEALVVPDDLAAALDAVPGARDTWEAQTPGRRKYALSTIALAKTDATRVKRIGRILDQLAAGRLES